MKKLLSLWCLLCLSLLVQAQQLTEIEYYFDEDPGYGMGEKLDALTEIEEAVDISNLAEGVHTLFVRAKQTSEDGDSWSLLQHRTFIKGVTGVTDKLPELITIEYYIDDDTDIGKGEPIDITTGETVFDVSVDGFQANLSGLSDGVHTLHIRAQDSNGHWSLLQQRTFIKGVVGINDAQPLINYLEYYIDDDPGLGEGESMDFTSDDFTLDKVNSNSIINLSNLKDGVHTIYVRAKDDNEHWSFLQSRTFIKLKLPQTEPTKITEIEVKVEGIEPYNEWTPLSDFSPDAYVDTDFAIIEMCDLPNGEYIVQARATDDAQITGPITDELFEIDCRIPQIFLNKGRIKDNEPLLVTGEGFKADCTLDIIVARFPTGDRNTYEATTNNEGVFEFNLEMPDDFEEGLYSIEVNCVDQDEPIVKLFEYEKTIPPLGIKIISPIKDEAIKGDQIIIRWNDLIVLQNQYTNFLGLNKQVSYNIYYKSEADEDWVFAKTHTEEIYKKIPKLFMTTIEVPFGGKHKVKVENAKNIIYYDESEEFVVNLINESHQVDLLWDKSFPNKDNINPIGVVSDGVARIILQLNDYTDLKNISRVDVTLSDPKGEATTTSILGKIMLAKDDITEYSNEANNATETFATWDIASYPTSQNAFNFWYVAPDDFSKNKNYYYDQARERQVTATFNITFMGNAEPIIIERSIRIVRPPLILVHGLGDSPDTWKNFKSTKTDDETVEFIYDDRFQFKNRLALEKFAHFEVNAKILLGVKYDSDGKTLILKDNIENSLIDNIDKVRSLGYACNQVNYVGHSMGGLVIRVATEEEKYPNLFYRDQNTKEYPYSNYGQGFVNRLITINTPHLGSEFADIADIVAQTSNKLFGGLLNSIAEDNDLDIYINLICLILNSNQIPITEQVANSIALYIENNEASCNLEIDINDAVENLKFLNGYQHPTSNLTSHLIAGELYGGDVLPDNTIYLNALEKIESEFSPFSRLLKIILMLIPEKYSSSFGDEIVGRVLEELLKKLKSKSIDNILMIQTILDIWIIEAKIYSIADYLEDSDFIVSLQSQLAGKKRYHSFTTVTSGVSHSTTFEKLGTPALESLKNGDTVFNKLNYSDKIGFTNNIPEKEIPELDDGGLLVQVFREIFEKMSQVDFSEINKNPEGIEIIQPKEADIVFADSLLNIKAHLKDTVGLVYADVTFQDEVLSFTNFDDTLINKTIAISDQYLGTQDLTVTGIYNYGDSTSLAIETISLEVKANETPTSLIVEPAINYGYTGESITPDYYAVFPTFVSELQSTNTDISVEIENDTIIEFNENNNSFLAKSAGETFAIIKYFDTADTAQFIIYQSYEEEPTDTMDTIDDVHQFQSFNQKINIYPNPAENVLNVDYTLPNSGNIQLEVVDLVGRTLNKITSKYHQPNEIKSAQISLDKIPSGMYIFYLKSDNQQVFSKKFIIYK